MTTKVENARFAPVAPPHILEALYEADPKGLFGSYHLFLAHLTVEREAEFRKLLSRWSNDRFYDPLTIIMDNSIVELGGSIDAAMMCEAVSICNVYKNKVIPVLPDVMGEGRATLKIVGATYDDWVLKVPAPEGFMLVTQGATWDDFTLLVDHYFIHHRARFKHITWVGVPRKLLDAGISRQKAVHYIKMVAPHVHIHLLGFSQDIVDDIATARMGVEGIDSAVPVRYDSLLSPSTTDEQIGKRPKYWFESGELTKTNMDNILNVRKWIQQVRV